VPRGAAPDARPRRNHLRPSSYPRGFGGPLHRPRPAEDPHALLVVDLVATSAVVTFTACGSETSHFDCCLNGASSCANQAQLDTCHLTSSNSACTRDSSKDSTCGAPRGVTAG
jgi:hypothetical protein